MHGVIPIRRRPPDRCKRERQVERNLGEGWTNTNLANQQRTRTPKDSKSRHRHIAAEGVGNEIDSVSKIDQRANPMVFAEWSATGLEKRLRGNHEDFHGVSWIVGIGW